MKILINNEEVVCSNKITIKEEMLSTSSTILNNCYPKKWEQDKNYVNRFYFPEDYSKCKIYDDNEKLIFCGVVKNTGNISLNPRHPHFCDLQILDFKTFLSEGETLDFVINNKTIFDSINQVIDFISDYGFVVGNVNIINGSDIINAYSTLNKTPYDVFQYLADVSQSKWTTRTIDEDTIAIDFYDPTLMQRGSDINYTTEYYKNNLIMDMSFSYSTNDYRNKQIILSDKVYSNVAQEETIISDGINNIYELEYEIGLLKSIIVNGNNKTITTKEQKNRGIIADFYYTPSENTIESTIFYSYGTLIQIEYTPLVRGRQIIFNNSEINRLSKNLNRKGIISRYEVRNDVLSSNELIKIGQSYIKYKGSAEISLKIQSQKDLFNVGQITKFNAPLQELSTDYMVKSKQIDMLITANKIIYTYELTSNFNSESAINYFDNQRMKTNGNIGEGETIIRNMDIENTLNIIFNNLSITEVEIADNNILNSALDSPFMV